MVHHLLIASTVLMGLNTSTAPSDFSFSCRFARGQWQPKDWIMVKSPYQAFSQDTWLQNDDSLENPVPNRPAKEWSTARGDETYLSMVYHRKFRGNFTVATTTAFDPRMAPLIVLADELGKSTGKDGKPEYRNYTEIVLFDQGVNVWTHTYHGPGKPPTYQLTAFARFPLRPKTPYRLEVSRKDHTLLIKVADHCFGVHAPAVPEALYIGITACEGRNQFRDFSVAPLDPKAPAVYGF